MKKYTIDEAIESLVDGTTKEDAIGMKMRGAATVEESAPNAAAQVCWVFRGEDGSYVGELEWFS